MCILTMQTGSGREKKHLQQRDRILTEDMCETTEAYYAFYSTTRLHRAKSWKISNANQPTAALRPCSLEPNSQYTTNHPFHPRLHRSIPFYEISLARYLRPRVLNKIVSAASATAWKRFIYKCSCKQCNVNKRYHLFQQRSKWNRITRKNVLVEQIIADIMPFISILLELASLAELIKSRSCREYITGRKSQQ